jgi:hypothetical protein
VQEGTQVLLGDGAFFLGPEQPQKGLARGWIAVGTDKKQEGPGLPSLQSRDLARAKQGGGAEE